MQISRLCSDAGPRMDYPRRNSCYHSIPPIPSLPQHLAPSFFDKHALGACCLEENGGRWKEKGPQTRMHRHEHAFTEDQRTGQGQKPSSGAVKGAFSQEAASAFPDVGADSQVLLSILSLGVTWCASPLSFASTLGYLFCFGIIGHSLEVLQTRTKKCSLPTTHHSCLYHLACLAAFISTWYQYS